MSDIKRISPMLDHYIIGEPFSDRNGIRCCPALEETSEEKYIVKVISVPETKTQLEALLLTGVYATEADALSYFREVAEGICQEVNTLQQLSAMEGFTAYTQSQIVPKEDGSGYDVYLLSPYQKSLEQNSRRGAMTHLDALTLGLDMCAALSVCRRAGYLYGNLKPANIYLSDNKQYQIGDLGFLRLDALKYQSLPERYRSPYTAPEITDAFSPLNETLDVYSIGMVLYQIYNGGALPCSTANRTEVELPAPVYADYEISLILQKCIAWNPADRWQTPIALGQALVNYMQHKGAAETPIVPVAVPRKEPEVVKKATIDLPQITYEEVSADFEETLAAADDLISYTIPVPHEPEPIIEETTPVAEDLPAGDFAEEQVAEVTEAAPEEIVSPVEEDSSAICEDVPSEPISEPEITEDADEVVSEEILDVAQEEEFPKPKRHRGRFIRNTLLILTLLGLLAGAAYYYLFYYLQPIHAIVVDGSQDHLTVLVTTDIAEDKLTVICTDVNGKQITAPLVNGKAEFEALTPNMQYTIEVTMRGFHRLVGDTSTTYSTPVITNIPHFILLNGTTEGTVLASFEVDGKDTEKWEITYSAPGEPEVTIAFEGHFCTISDLKVGKEYTFSLSSSSDLYITGDTQLQFTPERPILAKDLSIISCAQGTLKASWSTLEGTTVRSWTVRCYNGTDYDKTIVVTGTTAEFTDLDSSDSFTVVVTAENMSGNSTVSIPANSINVTDFIAQSNNTGGILLSWSVNQGTQPAGWLLTYGIRGSDITDTLPCSGNQALIVAAVPGETYWFTLQTAQGQPVLYTPLTFTAPAATDFTCTYKDGDESYTVGKQNIVFSMCKTPEKENWNKDDLRVSDYTTKFAPGDKASFLVQLSKPYGLSNDIIVTFYVVTDSNGQIVSTSSTQSTWTNMWYLRYCELDIPALPAESGDYSMNIYFNGMLAGSQEFTIN